MATPTPVPATVSVTAPAKVETGELAKFTSITATTAGLQHKWDFGDGATSDEAAPSHGYAKAGDYEVVLKVSNGAGESREVRSAVSVRALANVAGLVCTGANSSGWCWQRPRPNGNHTKALFFATPTVGWRVGDVGDIFKTTDGGSNWVHQPSGTTADLVEVHFADDRRGAALALGETLLTTADGGATWTLRKPPARNAFDPVPGFRLLPNDTIYLPDTSTAYLSTDGGANWTTVPKATAQSETGVFWYANEATRQVSRSSDGGRTLTPVYDFKAEAVDEGFVSLTAQIVARGDRTAVLRTRLTRTMTGPMGSDTFFKDVFHRTVDGGATWSRVEAENTRDVAPYDLFAVSADGMRLWSSYARSEFLGGSPCFSEDGGKTWQLTPGNFVLIAPTDGTAIEMSPGAYRLTEDFGKTWTAMTAPLPGYAHTLQRVGKDMLIAAPFTGPWLVTVDKGRTWKQLLPAQFESSDAYGFDAAFLDAKTGFILDPAGKLLATTDGGQTWTVRRNDLAVGLGGSVHAVDDKTVVVRDKDGLLLRSSDRGTTWVTDASSTRYLRVEFGKAGLGWGMDTSLNVVATTDAGLTWTRVTQPAMSTLGDIHQLDANAWVAVGSTLIQTAQGPRTRVDIATTQDGGKTWSAVTLSDEMAFSGNSCCVTSSDAKTLWAVGSGSAMLRSDDGGLHWQLVQTGLEQYKVLRDIAFIDAQRGWAVGESGAIIATTDGGKTWAKQESGSKRDLRRIHAIDGKTLWVSDSLGYLLATATGGER